MPIELVTGPANCGKANVLLAGVRGRIARGQEPLLVVPTRADQARYRRELADGGTVFGVRVERFEGLLLEVIGRAGLSAATLSSPARERLLARIAEVPAGTAQTLLKLIAELEEQRVGPSRLRGALRAWSAAERSVDRPERAQMSLFDDPRASPEISPAPSGTDASAGSGGWRTLEWVCLIYERYQSSLERAAVLDRELLSARALDRLRRAPRRWGGSPVFIYGFDDLTPLQLDAIETLGEAVGAEVTVSLAYEPGRLVFAGRSATFQRLLPLAVAHRALEARADYYAPSARAALHHLERSLLCEGAHRERCDGAIALLEGRSPRGELDLLASELRRLLDSGVAPAEVAIVHRSPQRIVVALGEALAAQGIPHALTRRIAFADTAIGRAALGAARCALGDGSLADLLAWLRSPGMLKGPQLADRLEARARRRGVRSAEAARALWEAERWPLERIDRLRRSARSGLGAFASALQDELERLFGAPREHAAAMLESRELEEAGAVTGALRALAGVRELARVDRSLAGESGELVIVLERLQLDVGERTDSDRVGLFDPLSLRARRVRALFLCGLQEGVFPALPTPPAISEQQRRALAQASGLVLHGAPDALANERYLLYALASRPEQRLTLSWHAADEDGNPCARSLFVEDICDLFEPIAVQSERAGELRAGDPTRGEAPALPSAVPPAAGRRAVGETIRALVDERVLAELRGRRLWSASSLALWASCPVRWFVERLLGGEELEPEAEQLARGGLAHAALKACLEQLREQTGSGRITTTSLPPARSLLEEALQELRGEFALADSPTRALAAHRRLHADLDRYLRTAAEQPSELEPTYFELQFGFEDDGLAPLDLGEGVLLRGRIDRVDIGPAGEAVLYDYKGRAATPGARWLRERSWQLALYMRVAQRLLDVRTVGGFYQPLAGQDLKPRGVLESDAGLELDCVRTDLFESDELERLLESCEAAAREAALEARAGALEPRPATCAYAGGCAHPAICRCVG